jgi:hypothetical protein
VILTFTSRIIKIEEKFRMDWMSGYGKEALFTRTSLGWFIQLEGSGESVFISQGKPGWIEGDYIKVTFEKVNP